MSEKVFNPHFGSEALKCDGQQLRAGTGAQVALEGWTELSIAQMSVLGQGCGRCLGQDFFDEMSSTHCGGPEFTPSHHTPANFAFKVNLWITFALFALLHF